MNFENDYSWSKPYIGADERILWSGKPGKGRLLNKFDIYLIPFSIFWCGFVVFWEVAAITHNAPFEFMLFGIPFVLVGLYITIGRLLYRKYIRSKTAYVITNRKIIRLRNKKIDTLEGSGKSQISISVKKDGSGTISFGNTLANFVFNASWLMEGRSFELINIEDVNRVHQIIQSMDR